MLPRIVDDPIGFHWATPEGRATRLADLLDLPDADPGRWLPTHLEALDDHLIAMAARFGEVMGAVGDRSRRSSTTSTRATG